MSSEKVGEITSRGWELLSKIAAQKDEALSQDGELQALILEAVAAGVRRVVIAEAAGVSEATVYRIARANREP